MTNYMLVVISLDLKRLPALLAAWKRIGVPGVTLTNSVGGYQAVNWLERSGNKISFLQFLGYGIPVVFVSLVIASIWLWLVYLH